MNRIPLDQNKAPIHAALEQFRQIRKMGMSYSLRRGPEALIIHLGIPLIQLRIM